MTPEHRLLVELAHVRQELYATRQSLYRAREQKARWKREALSYRRLVSDQIRNRQYRDKKAA